MLKFGYSHIDNRLTCGDCESRSICSKQGFRKLRGTNSDICMDFNRKDSKPKVRNASVDFFYLKRQLTDWNCAVDTIKSEYRANWFGLGVDLSEKPSFTECIVFKDINNIFLEYLSEYDDMLTHSEAILEILLQTVYSVDSSTNKVKIYTEDKMLQDKIEDYLKKTEYVLKEDTYEDILGIRKKPTVKGYIIF